MAHSRLSNDPTCAPSKFRFTPLTGLDLDALSDALDNQPIRACWFMTNFQNPTGVTMSVEKKKALVELLARLQVPLIEDDVMANCISIRSTLPPPSHSIRQVS